MYVNVYFSQGDEGAADCDAIDRDGLSCWLDSMTGASDWEEIAECERERGIDAAASCALPSGALTAGRYRASFDARGGLAAIDYWLN